VAGENQIDGFPRLSQRRVIEPAFRVDGGEACAEEQWVAFTERDCQAFGQSQQHLATWSRTPCFQEAHMSRGNVGVARQLELAEAPALSPHPQLIAN
jgi:hypothetical protein